jgi:type IV pilus assembly protein PilX
MHCQIAIAAVELRRPGLAVPLRQRGATLVVGLLFLVLMTLVATVAMRQSITQERMAGGLRNYSLARNGAESAARQAERSIFDYYLTSNGAVLVGDDIASQGVHMMGQIASYRSDRALDGGSTASTQFDSAIHDFTDTSAMATAALAAQPEFAIEDLGRVRPPGAGPQGEGGSTGKENYEGSGGGSPAGNSDIRMYRVTAKSTGGLDTVTRTVETSYAGRAKG